VSQLLLNAKVVGAGASTTAYGVGLIRVLSAVSTEGRLVVRGWGSARGVGILGIRIFWLRPIRMLFLLINLKI
jgi:hypothetical protein